MRSVVVKLCYPNNLLMFLFLDTTTDTLTVKLFDTQGILCAKKHWRVGFDLPLTIHATDVRPWMHGHLSPSATPQSHGRHPMVRGLHENLLRKLKDFMNGYGSLKILRGVAVVSGPGRFTAVRLGIVAANAIGYALNIPVVAVRSGEQIPFVRMRNIKRFKPVVPWYGKEPSITLKTRNT